MMAGDSPGSIRRGRARTSHTPKNYQPKKGGHPVAQIELPDDRDGVGEISMSTITSTTELYGKQADNDNIKYKGPRYRSKNHLDFDAMTGKSIPLSGALLPQIGKLIGVRYGGPCTDDQAEHYYDLALPYLIDRAIAKRDTLSPNTSSWLRWCAPGILNDNGTEWVRQREAETVEAWFEHDRVTHGEVPFPPDGRKLSVLLQLTAEEMRAGDIRFLSPVDRTADELKQDRLVRDAARQQAKRDGAGVRPHSSSVEALQLWTAIGIGRRRFYTLKAAGELPPLPLIPRGEDPAPYVEAFVKVFRENHRPAT